MKNRLERFEVLNEDDIELELPGQPKKASGISTFLHGPQSKKNRIILAVSISLCVFVVVLVALPLIYRYTHLTHLKKVVIDTDGGVDDIFTILTLLQAHLSKQIEVEAITTVAGVQSSLETALLVRRILVSAGIDGVQVYRGSEKDERLSPGGGHEFTEDPNFKSYQVSGDALALVEFHEDNLYHEVSTGAVQFLSKHEDKDTVLLLLGPTTNIVRALTWKKDDVNILNNFLWIIQAGGVFSTQGDTPNSVSEWNFYFDPSASSTYLNHIQGKPVYLYPLDITLTPGITSNQTQELLNIPSPGAAKANLMALGDLMKAVIRMNPLAVMRSTVAAASFLHSDLFMYNNTYVGIDSTTGQSEVRAKPHDGEQGVGPMTVAQSMETDRYFGWLKGVISGNAL